MNTPHAVTPAATPTMLPAAGKTPKKAKAAKPKKAKPKKEPKRPTGKSPKDKAKKAKRVKVGNPTKAAKKKAPKANSAKPHTLTGRFAFEARPWRDPTDVKATMNPKEQKVYDALRGGKPHTLEALAERAFAHKPSVAKSKSWVRNALRRLRDGKLVKRVDAGTYQRVA